MLSNLRSCVLVISWLSALPLWSSHGAQAASLRAGAAVSDVTPNEFPVSMLGSFADRKATTAHDPLRVRAIVLDDGKSRLAIAICDSCAISAPLFDRAKELASARTGIPTDRMLTAATHTHSAPAAVELSDIPVDPVYTRHLVNGIADAIAAAAGRLQPAKIGWAVRDVPEEVFNRRWFMKDGAIPPNPFGHVDKVRMNPPAGSPDLLRPAGPTDPGVSALSLQTLAGKQLAVLANYSLHYVGDVPPGMVSADYFGECASQIQRRLAPDASDGEFIAMLSNGTSGDVNNINFQVPRQKGEPFSRIRSVAGRVATAAVEALAEARFDANAPLAMAQTELVLAVRRPGAAEVARAQSILAADGDKNIPALARYYAESCMRLSRYPETVTLKLQALRIGGLGIVAIPCEVFAEIGLEIKRRSPLKPTFTIQLANGYHGYLPSPRQHALGGYETWPATSSYLEVDASTKITETVLDLLAKL